MSIVHFIRVVSKLYAALYNYEKEFTLDTLWYLLFLLKLARVHGPEKQRVFTPQHSEQAKKIVLSKSQMTKRFLLVFLDSPSYWQDILEFFRDVGDQFVKVLPKYQKKLSLESLMPEVKESVEEKQQKSESRGKRIDHVTKIDILHIISNIQVYHLRWNQPAQPKEEAPKAEEKKEDKKMYQNHLPNAFPEPTKSTWSIFLAVGKHWEDDSCIHVS